MEPKKSPKADLENKKGLFLEIGLAATLLLIIGFFTVSQSERKIEAVVETLPPVEEEIIEVTRQEDKPYVPLKQTVVVVSDILNIVQDDAKIEEEIDFSDFEDDAVMVTSFIHGEPGSGNIAIGGDEPFIIVEDMPSFQGGDLQKFRNWVSSRIQYPEVAKAAQIGGRVVAEFVIEKDGSLTNIVILQQPDRSLGDEVIRLLKSSPKWKPGMQRKQAVRVKYTMPIEFRLG